VAGIATIAADVRQANGTVIGPQREVVSTLSPKMVLPTKMIVMEGDAPADPATSRAGKCAISCPRSNSNGLKLRRRLAKVPKISILLSAISSLRRTTRHENRKYCTR
jgi:hypothetical protein